MSTLALLLVLSAGFGQEVRQSAPPARRPAQAELLVQLRPDSDAGEQVARAAGSGAVPSAEVIEYVASVGRDLGIPLEAKRLASGGSVLVALQTDELSDRIAQRLSREPSIKTARSLARIEGGDSGEPRVIHVELAPDSRDAELLAREVASGSGTPRALTEKLQRLSGVPVRAEARDGGQIQLTIDLPVLLSQLAANLLKRPEVKAAQPNATYRLPRPDKGV
jgi:hypothetical protein